MKKKKLKKAKKVLLRKKQFLSLFFDLKRQGEQKIKESEKPKKIQKYVGHLNFIDFAINDTLKEIKEQSDFLKANDPNYVKDGQD
jgi:hypothetical protein